MEEKGKEINKLFCGGSFSFDYRTDGFREKAVNDYRAIILGNVELLLEKNDYIALGDNLRYIGPFYFEAEDMCARTIVCTELSMIRTCTHAVFYWTKHRAREQLPN